MSQLAETGVSLGAKGSLLDALDMLLRVPNLPKTALINEVPGLLNALLRLRREFASQRNKNSINYAEYVALAEKSRSVLEKLGHSEGRDAKKY